jgi:hypothetical protein
MIMFQGSLKDGDIPSTAIHSVSSIFCPVNFIKIKNFLTVFCFSLYVLRVDLASIATHYGNADADFKFFHEEYILGCLHMDSCHCLSVYPFLLAELFS